MVILIAIYLVGVLVGFQIRKLYPGSLRLMFRAELVAGVLLWPVVVLAATAWLAVAQARVERSTPSPVRVS